MWIVASYKTKEINTLKKNLKRILGNAPDYFIPEIEYQKNIGNKFKTFQKTLLEGYLICFDKKFKDSNIINNLKFAKGLNYLLDGYKNNQDEILSFVKKCKKFQNSKGYLTQEFFEESNLNKGKFVSGPFTNLIFDILSKNSKKTEILIGKYKTTISKNSNFLYRPI
jgi:hypothetical protein